MEMRTNAGFQSLFNLTIWFLKLPLNALLVFIPKKEQPKGDAVSPCLCL